MKKEKILDMLEYAYQTIESLESKAGRCPDECIIREDWEDDSEGLPCPCNNCDCNVSLEKEEKAKRKISKFLEKAGRLEYHVPTYAEIEAKYLEDELRREEAEEAMQRELEEGQDICAKCDDCQKVLDARNCDLCQ